ncbi:MULTISPECIES: hypothetical protein [Streptomyces]|uniref:Uncharacterized protein n=1 Tax=Streptomyces lonegramiae TaxID=3075524 RepID=A0ABU2XCV1_9ACTN|nr:hypothetical protein [Streptomyces sp. DSM 41529]MDT0543739.1 hypothetical protein [Streptomyces sp. DSM 41529]
MLNSRAVLIGQFVLAVYGGYFGGAVGILMLALWSIGLGLDAAVGKPMRIAQLAAIYLSARCCSSPPCWSAPWPGASLAPISPVVFPPGCLGASSRRPP